MHMMHGRYVISAHILTSTTDIRGNKKIGNMRDRATVNRLKMYKSGGKAVHDKNGKLLRAMPFQSRAASGTVARVAPNRKWFGNTRTISQRELEQFREAMVSVKNDPYKVSHCGGLDWVSWFQ